MAECPHCGSRLQRPATPTPRRTRSEPGRESTGAALVTCPACDRVIDGLSPH